MIQPEKPKGSRTAKIRRIIGDDYYDLKLAYDQLVELQEVTGVGPFYLNRHLVEADHLGWTGNFKIEWVYDIIRLGLIGSGEFQPRDAVRFCDRHIRSGFILDYIEPAAAALNAALYGPEEEPVVVEAAEPGEPEPEVDVTPTPSAASNGENIGNSPEPSEPTRDPFEK